MFNINQYTKDQSHRAQLRREAEQIHLANKVQGDQWIIFRLIYNNLKKIMVVSPVVSFINNHLHAETSMQQPDKGIMHK